MSFSAILLLGLSACLLTSYFGPFSRKYSIVFFLGMALGCQGLALTLREPYHGFFRIAVLVFGAGTAVAYVLQVRNSLRTLKQERGARSQILAQQMAEWQQESTGAETGQAAGAPAAGMPQTDHQPENARERETPL